MPLNHDMLLFVRGISAVRSAPHWQCGGQGFESPMLHQKRAAPFRVFALFSSINIRGFEPERVPALRKQFSELFLAGSDAAGY